MSAGKRFLSAMKTERKSRKAIVNLLMITTVRGQSKEEKKDDKERQLDEQLPHVVVQAHHTVFTTGLKSSYTINKRTFPSIHGLNMDNTLPPHKKFFEVIA